MYLFGRCMYLFDRSMYLIGVSMYLERACICLGGVHFF